MKSDITIILSGGGFRCAWGAGVMLALQEKYGLKAPRMIFSSSASTPTAMYYVTGQYEEIRRMWVEETTRRKLVNFWRFWRIYDIEYLLRRIREKHPIDGRKLRGATTELYITAINSTTGALTYFHNETEPYSLLHAAFALPFLYGRTANVGGENYVDPLNFSTLAHHIKKAQSLGATKLLIINSKDMSYPLEKIGGKLWLMMRPRNFRETFNKQIRDAQASTLDIPSFTLRPQTTFKMSPIRPGNIREVIEQGYQEAIHNKELEGFLR